MYDKDEYKGLEVWMGALNIVYFTSFPKERVGNWNGGGMKSISLSGD